MILVIIIFTVIMTENQNRNESIKNLQSEFRKVAKATQIEGTVSEVKCPSGVRCVNWLFIVVGNSKNEFSIHNPDIVHKQFFGEVIQVGARISKKSNNDTISVFSSGVEYKFLLED